MGYTVTSVQSTPNPNAAKFMLDRPISDQPISFFNPEAAQGHGLGSRLFEISGVSSLLLLGDFLTINKRPDAKWEAITPQVKQLLANHGSADEDR